MLTNYPPVLSKPDFIRRFIAGEFGNRGPNWQTLEEYLASGYKGLIHIRNRTAGGPTFYNVPAEDVEDAWYDLPSGNYYLAGMAPHDRNLIQGEVASVSGLGLQLRYSKVPYLPMRDAFALGTKTESGIIASLLLTQHLCPNSYEWLQTLLSRYPGHVIEFSCFSCNWGTLPNFNTVFWEVRNY